jgi:hypothetical protein
MNTKAMRFYYRSKIMVERQECVINGNSEPGGIYHSGNLPADSGCLFSRAYLMITGETS